MSERPAIYAGLFCLLMRNNYFFDVTSEGVQLRIEQDIAPEYEQYMQQTWPLALQRLKALCEAS